MKASSGKRAFVTGGTRGIGLAIASRLKKEGVSVAITGTKPKANVKTNFDYHAVDFNVPEEVEAFADILKQEKPDILINNAGTNKINDFSDIGMSEFSRIQQINLNAPFQLCKAVITPMKEKGWGRIVNITSIWSKVSNPGRASYSASKFALDGMTTALAAEVAEQGILVNCVSPGVIETELTRSILGEEGTLEMSKSIPIKRLGKPEEVAALVAWLVSDENTYISGQNIAIDGGFTRV